MNIRKQAGAATLIITVIIMLAAAMLMFYTAQHSVMQQKSASNQYQAAQSFEAAEGGLEFGIAYLNANAATVTANPSGGYINYGSSDANVTNVTLTNNSKFSVVYTNPTQNNYRLIQITSTGVSSDGTSTRIVRQLVYKSGSLPGTLTSRRSFTASGNVNISGDPYAVYLGSSMTLSGNNNISSSKVNDTEIYNMTSDQLFQSLMGTTKATMQSQSTYYANTTGVPWSSLSGNVWINSSVVLSGKYTIGTSANPVLLMVKGNFIASGKITVNGLLYVMGSTTGSGSFNLNGGLVSDNAVTMSGSTLSNNTSILNKVLTGGSFAKIPGSWKDF